MRWSNCIPISSSQTPRRVGRARGPSSWSMAASRCTGRSCPPLALRRKLLPSTATARGRRRPGRRSQSASHALTVFPPPRPSTRASARPIVASPETRQRRVSRSRRTPSATRTGGARQRPTRRSRPPAGRRPPPPPSTLASGCRSPRRSRGSGSSPAVPAGQDIRARQAGGRAEGGRSGGDRMIRWPARWSRQVTRR
jgi:hypothetical protein